MKSLQELKAKHNPVHMEYVMDVARMPASKCLARLADWREKRAVDEHMQKQYGSSYGHKTLTDFDLVNVSNFKATKLEFTQQQQAPQQQAPQAGFAAQVPQQGEAPQGDPGQAAFQDINTLKGPFRKLLDRAFSQLGVQHMNGPTKVKFLQAVIQDMMSNADLTRPQANQAVQRSF